MGFLPESLILTTPCPCSLHLRSPRTLQPAPEQGRLTSSRLSYPRESRAQKPHVSHDQGADSSLKTQNLQ